MCDVKKKSASGYFLKISHFIMGDLKIFGWRLKKYIYSFGRRFYLKPFGVYSKMSVFFFYTSDTSWQSYARKIYI